MTEQDILDQFINPRFNPPVPGITLGPGDDAAVLQLPQGQELVVTTDTLVQEVHFFKQADPYHLGYKAVAVNLSDLAAMGAKPLWLLSNLTLPEANPDWLSAFSKGVYACCQAFKVALVGGNLTQGPLVLSFTALGLVPQGKAVRRSGAKLGDYIVVSGTIGAAALAFHLQTTGRSGEIPQACADRFHQPCPRVALGQALRAYATSMIDITDGLTKDCQRLAQASQLQAKLYAGCIPLPESCSGSALGSEIWELLISFGDDYELCFTLPERFVNQNLDSYHSDFLEQLSAEYEVPLTIIGRMQAGEGLVIQDETGRDLEFSRRGHDHFQKSN